MEYYENGGQATARLLWSSASIAEGRDSCEPAVPRRTASGHPDQLPDSLGAGARPATCRTAGAVYGSSGNGQTYGWMVDNTAHARDRNSRDRQISATTRSPTCSARRIRTPSGRLRCRTAPTACASSRRRVVLRQRLSDRREGCCRGQRHANERGAVGRGRRHGHRDRWTVDAHERRRREQQQDLFRRNNTEIVGCRGSRFAGSRVRQAHLCGFRLRAEGSDARGGRD